MTSAPPLPTESRSDVITQRLAEVLYLHHPQAVCISDMTTGTIVDVNRSFEAMFGFSRAEAKTLAISRITDPGHRCRYARRQGGQYQGHDRFFTRVWNLSITR
jgi:PAS domain S-box-containing protein